MISKPPGAITLARLIERFKACTKPVIGCFLGARIETQNANKNFHCALTIDEAVRIAIRMAGKESTFNEPAFTPEELDWMSHEKAAWTSEQRYVRGLFAGGTFCYQSQQIFRDSGIIVHSNAPLDSKYKLVDSNHSLEHTLVDMGADEYTLDKPHLMIMGL